MKLREISPDDVDAVQELIESDPGYTERITGYPPGSADAQSLLMMRPDGLKEEAKVGQRRTGWLSSTSGRLGRG